LTDSAEGAPLVPPTHQRPSQGQCGGFVDRAVGHDDDYLYSLSVNPDQRQGRLTREQYLDYIDLYGNMNSLPKLIDDKKVRTKNLREFLGKEFPKDSLPTVDEALALAAGHRAAMELFRKDEDRVARDAKESVRRDALHRRQQDRRAPVEQESMGLIDRQRQARAMSSPTKRRNGRRSGRTICRRASASGSTARRIGRRD
jgi:hypothetical protein